ncbi:Gfo/Idh/MocA family oxidoreductase [Metabacillus sp. KIGAM252]|uniref:Gfo/Idh/MocA family oxidoreductase n=1 Tax=Metabacillus flavus TaxID=2823519 RepID=A0ABS5LGG1_9BACI|nr:Gfo/Idh/MocA family oxidoreductase [Metabacillus flavus]MBS2969830.1 Gfo/Idh/MocA family oxidoreductase [Metabacillus flavus]
MLDVALIGLDTSHAEIFTDLVMNPENPHFIKGVSIKAAYPGGSEDFPLSRNRVEHYTSIVRDKYHIEISETPEEAAGKCDAVWITSVDGRRHEELLRQVCPFGLPVFIDKPFSVAADSAKRMVDFAKEWNVPLMSSSSLRFGENLKSFLSACNERIHHAECIGPLLFEKTQPGYFWYGIHLAEMLFSIMGKGCESVQASVRDEMEMVMCEWGGARTGTIIGTKTEQADFEAFVSMKSGEQHFNLSRTHKPYYASLLDQVVHFSKTGRPVPENEETLEIIHFIEAVNQSRNRGGERIVIRKKNERNSMGRCDT